jgi:phosphoribosylcarboxyaminoimidazole (NCAIR) mutase
MLIFHNPVHHLHAGRHEMFRGRLVACHETPARLDHVLDELRRRPVGEALVMTAAGLAVAIPAVLAYNVFGKMVGSCEAELEGFAHDLREMVLDTARAIS